MATARGGARFPFGRVSRHSLRHARRPAKYDIVQSIRTLTLVAERHAEKRSGGRFHFRAPAEMAAVARNIPTGFGTRWKSPSGATSSFLSASRNSPPSRRPTVPAPRSFCAGWCCGVCKSVTGTRAEQFRPQVMEELGHHWRGRLRGIFSHHLGFSAGLPGARHRVDHARQRGRQPGLLLPWHQRRLPDSLRSLFPAFSQQRAHGAAQTARHRH
jgi:hypothetical protein